MVQWSKIIGAGILGAGALIFLPKLLSNDENNSNGSSSGSGGGYFIADGGQSSDGESVTNVYNTTYDFPEATPTTLSADTTKKAAASSNASSNMVSSVDSLGNVVEGTPIISTSGVTTGIDTGSQSVSILPLTTKKSSKTFSSRLSSVFKFGGIGLF